MKRSIVDERGFATIKNYNKGFVLDRVLVVDDDDLFRKALVAVLEQHFNVFPCKTIEEAKLALEQSTFDLYLLDLSLPDGSGLELCSMIQGFLQDTAPLVLIISGQGEVSTKVACFELGADDYLTKPFNEKELLARIHAKLKRTRKQKDSSKIFTKGEFQVNFSMNQVHVISSTGKRLLLLSNTEYKLLTHFLSNEGQVFTRDQLMNYCFGSGHFVSDRSIDTHICSLRKKIGLSNGKIITHFRIGYSFEFEGGNNG